MFKRVCGFVFVIAFLVSLSLSVQAGTVGDPVGLDFPKGPGIITKDQFIEEGLNPIYFSGMTEFLFKKQLDSSNTSNLELDGFWHLGKLSVVFKERLRPFILFGVSKLDVSGDSGATKVTSTGDVNLAYGGGFSWCFLENISKYDIALALNGLYRESKLDGDMTNPTSTITDLDTKVEELEFALTAYKDLTVCKVLIRPYISIIYSDSDVNFSFKDNNNGTVYDFGDVDNNRNVGIALGCEEETLKGMSINAELRLITEEALTLGVSLKF